MSTYTSSLGLEEITPGDQAGLWGNTTNNNLALIDQAVTGVTPISFTGLSSTVYTLTSFDGAVDEARASVLNITGIATGSNTVVVPNKQKTYLVRNDTGQNVIFRTASPSATYTVGAGNSILIFCDGNNNVFTGIASPSVGTLGVAGGGTGQTTFGGGGFVKSSGGTNALTSSATVNLTSEVTGILPVTNGGTGGGSFTSGSLIVGGGSSNFGTLVGGSAGQVATWNGSTWTAATPASAGVSTLTAGTGISVSSPTGAVTVTNTGVTSISAGTGISVSSSTGGVTITNTGPTLSGTNNFTGTNNYNTSANISMSGSTAGDQRVSVTGGGVTSGMSGSGVQIAAGGWGFIGNGSEITVVQGGTFSTAFRGTGNFQSNNSPNWATTSDINIKTNLRPINDALGKLTSLNPCHFEYKNEIGKTRSGFIAQEFETIFPGHTLETGVPDKYKEFVPDGVEKLKALDLNLVPYLVKAIQELKAELDAAKAEIAALKAK